MDMDVTMAHGMAHHPTAKEDNGHTMDHGHHQGGVDDTTHPGHHHGHGGADNTTHDPEHMDHDPETMVHGGGHTVVIYNIVEVPLFYTKRYST